MKSSLLITLLLLTIGATLLAQTTAPSPPNPLLVAGFYDRLTAALRNPKKTTPVGNRQKLPTFTALPSEGAVLVGVAVKKGDWFGTPIISSLQPIYETRAGRIRGAALGMKGNELP